MFMDEKHGPFITKIGECITNMVVLTTPMDSQQARFLNLLIPPHHSNSNSNNLFSRASENLKTTWMELKY